MLSTKSKKLYRLGGKIKKLYRKIMEKPFNSREKWLQWFVSAGTTILSPKTAKKGPFFHSDEVLTSGIKLTCLRKTWWFSRPKVYSQMKNSFLDFELYFLHFFPMEKWALLFFKLFFQSSGKTIVFPTEWKNYSFSNWVEKTIVFPTEWRKL